MTPFSTPSVSISQKKPFLCSFTGRVQIIFKVRNVEAAFGGSGGGGEGKRRER